MAATKFHFDGPKALPLEFARTPICQTPFPQEMLGKKGVSTPLKVLLLSTTI